MFGYSILNCTVLHAWARTFSDGFASWFRFFLSLGGLAGVGSRALRAEASFEATFNLTAKTPIRFLPRSKVDTSQKNARFEAKRQVPPQASGCFIFSGFE